MADIFKKIAGIIGNLFHFDGGEGPLLKNNASTLEVRTFDDSAFGKLRVATPTGDNDAVNKLYADTLEKPLIIKRQADTSSSIPGNTAVRGFVVVSTAGSGAAIGDVLYDDGSNTGTMAILTAVEGRTIAVTDALGGGTVTFNADTIYLWDEDGGAWLGIGDLGTVTGALRVLRYAITNSASQDSSSTLPAGARVFEARCEVTTPYSGGAVITVGRVGDTDAFIEAGDIKEQNAGLYSVDQDTLVASASVVRTTITGAPAAGAGVVTVFYSVVNV